MSITDKLGFEIPAENQGGWYPIFVTLMNDIDASAYIGIENAMLYLSGGGIITLDDGADELTWTQDFHLIAPMTAGDITIEATTLTGVEDGKIVYLEVARPVNGTRLLTFSVGDSIGDNLNKVFIAQRRGVNMIFRNIISG